jgi:hypothetical protein
MDNLPLAAKMGSLQAEEEPAIKAAATPPIESATDEPPAETSGTGLRRTVSIEDQSTRLPPRKLAMVTMSLIFAIFLSSFEQVSVSTTLPGIARDFGTSSAISWVGTSFLVAKSVSLSWALIAVFPRRRYILAFQIFLGAKFY